MKITCDFCKTEYRVERIHGPVTCVVCGREWTPSAPRGKNSLLVFFAALTALLAAIVFAVVATTGGAQPDVPLIATISEITTTTDDNNVQHFVINGNVKNNSDEIYGVPDLIIISHGENGDIVARQKFMPSATLLESNQTVNFSHTLATSTAGVKKITVELAE